MRAGGVLLIALLALAPLGAGAQEEPPGAPPEPEGFRMETYRAPTPATLAGAEVIGTAKARALWEAGDAVFIDSMPAPARPEGLPESTYWRTPQRETIPGALWLPNTGYGLLPPKAQAYLEAGLETATQGDRAAPVVIFCLRDCWMSWNAAKRAVEVGYTGVHWYPDGLDGWTGAGLPVQPTAPWEASAG